MYEYISLLYSYLTRAIFVPIIVVLYSYPPNPKQFVLFSYPDIESYHIRTLPNLHFVPYSYPLQSYYIRTLPTPNNSSSFRTLICNRTIFVPYLFYISCHIRTHYSRTLFVPSQSQTIRPLFVPDIQSYHIRTLPNLHFVPYSYPLQSYSIRTLPIPNNSSSFRTLIYNRTCIFVPYLFYISCHIRTHYSRTPFVPSQSQTIRPLFVP